MLYFGQGVWRCALCLKIRQSLMFTGAWYHDVSPRERFQVQEMLNRLAEESVRRLEMVGTSFFPYISHKFSRHCACELLPRILSYLIKLTSY